MNNIKTYSLNIHLISFQLPDDSYHDGNKIRIGITTLPEHKKAKFTISATKIEHSNHVFTVNAEIPTKDTKDLPPNATKKVIISIRRKGSLSKPMIGTAIIHAYDFPKLGKKDVNENFINGNVKIIDVYEPIDQQMKEIEECEKKGLAFNFEETDHHTVKRKAIGQMQIQLSLSPSFEEQQEMQANKISTNKHHNKHGHHNVHASRTDKHHVKKNSTYRHFH
ncbi:hypothetical protein M9Y10_031406 [Tritrichomonas musculus]|uniref:MSP domain-containing protein n=1 Tax=Tritrichomonas musculus TaxID=1915356 RepID=A0ABR2H291_9EUKA